MRARISLITAALTLGTAAADPPLPNQSPPRSASDSLSASGIDPTVAGISAFLASQIPDDNSLREAEAAIAELRSPDFLTRERAERTLGASPNLPLDTLSAAAADPSDPELALRAERILSRAKARPRTTLHTVLRHIEKAPDPAYLPHILALAAHLDSPADQSLLVRALAAIPTPGAADALATLAADPHESFRLAAAAALAARGDRRSLAPLGSLLSSDSTAIRTRSHQLLHSLTGKSFGFKPNAPAADRSPAARDFLLWIESEGATADLAATEASPRDAPYIGRTVVANWPDRFQLHGEDGNLLFAAPHFQYVWGCHATADGQFAVIDSKRRSAHIFDSAGNQLWTMADLPGEPSDIKILDSGNRLITLSEPSLVFEIDPDNNTVWKIEFPAKARSTTAQRLPNGNTLINLQFAKKVVEVNPAGESVWELKGLENCLTAQALPGGNILVCEMNLAKAVEYNREGEIVWEHGGFDNACQAQRLPNGNTLISDTTGIHEIDPDGNKVAHIPVKRGRFWRF